MRVPHTDLLPDTLINLIEAFVAREGTDYGSVERSMESKIADVMRQLENGSAFVTYDEASDSASIVARDTPAVVIPAAAPERDYGSAQRSYAEGSQDHGYEEESQVRDDEF